MAKNTQNFLEKMHFLLFTSVSCHFTTMAYAISIAKILWKMLEKLFERRLILWHCGKSL
jgi:hypothetical protein